uniref:Transposase n=1 Tax=Bacillus phage Jabberwock TaxID=3163548 RepID=A0AAU8EIS6_9CAUD
MGHPMLALLKAQNKELKELEIKKQEFLIKNSSLMKGGKK